MSNMTPTDIFNYELPKNKDGKAIGHELKKVRCPECRTKYQFWAEEGIPPCPTCGFDISIAIEEKKMADLAAELERMKANVAEKEAAMKAKKAGKKVSRRKNITATVEATPKKANETMIYEGVKVTRKPMPEE